MNVIPARVGDTIDEIDTPALIVDLDAFEHNIDKLAAFARSAGVRLRPHAKTHKCPDDCAEADRRRCRWPVLPKGR